MGLCLYNIELLNSLLKFSEFPFTIESIIIESGQRTVYRGISHDQRSVVIKTLFFNEIKVGRIQREIRVLSQIDSDYFPHFHWQTYVSKDIIQDYKDNLSGETLIDEFQKNLPKPFFVTCEEYIDNVGWDTFKNSIKNEISLIDFTIHVFNALQILWSNDIVHRDIKPDNILIRPDLTPVIIDLGIAKSMRPGTQNFTLIGIAPCTPQYAAPEQFERESEVTYKADQFAIGVILYHLVTGIFPYGKYEEIDAEGLIQNFKSIKPAIATEINKNISICFANFINRLIEVQPYKRYRNIDTIQEALSNIKKDLSC